MASKRKQIINPLVGFGQRAIGPYANRIGQGTYARNLNRGEGPADFQAFGELNGVIKALIRGEGFTQFGRSTEASVRVFGGLIDTSVINEIRFENGRRVENKAPERSNAFGVGSGTVSEIGGTGSSTVFDCSSGLASGNRVQIDTRPTSGVGAAQDVVITFEIRGKNGSEGNSLTTRAFDQGTNSLELKVITLPSSFTRYKLSGTTVVSGFIQLWFYNAAARDFEIKNIQVEESNQDPSEYVSGNVGTGPEETTNGSFDNGTTGWNEVNNPTFSVTSGVASLAHGGTDFGRIVHTLRSGADLEPGYYVFSYSITANTGSNEIRLTTNSAGGGGFDVASKTITSAEQGSVAGWHDGGQLYIAFLISTAGTSMEIEYGLVSRADHGANVDAVRYYAYENGNTVDGDNVVHAGKGPAITDYRALFEPGATSYINEPTDFTLGANWVATGFAGTSQSSLDSSLKGFKLWRLEETTGSTGTRGITSNVHTKAAAAEVWHAEIIARPDQIGWIKLGIENSAETSYVFQFFNLNTGAVGGNLALNWGHVRGEAEQLANGDWRFRVFGVTNNETSIRLRCNLAETDNDDFFNVPAGDGCYIQAANLKQEDAASSFVYSTGGSGSRSADVPSPMFDFGNFSQTEGTWYMDVWFALFQSEVIGLFSVANNESNVLYKGGTASFRTSDSNGSPASAVNIVGATAYNRYRPVAEFSQGDTLDIGYRDIDGLGVFAWDGAPESYGGAFPTNSVMNICYDIAVPVRIRDFQGFTTRKGRTWVENNL